MNLDSEEVDWLARYRAIETLIADPAGLVKNGAVFPHWINNLAFWYTREGEVGREVRIVEVERPEAARTVEFSLLVKAANEGMSDRGTAIRERDISIVSVAPAADRITFKAKNAIWEVGFDGTNAVARDPESPFVVPNPQGTATIEVRDHNLFLQRDSVEVQLTQDGESNYAYASAPLSARASQIAIGNAVEGKWSPDGTKFFTLLTDERSVRELPLIDYVPDEGVRPKVRTNLTSLPGDEHVTLFTLLLVDTISGQVNRIDHPKLPAVRMNSTVFSDEMVWWSADSSTVYFVSIPRGEARADVIACEAATGKTRLVFSEVSDSYVDVSVNVYAPALARHLPNTNKLVWYSERTGNGHLYLYDLATGEMERALTEGEWRVLQTFGSDPSEKHLYFLAAGVDSDASPYATRPMKVSISSGSSSVESLVLDSGTHRVWRPSDYDMLLDTLTSGEASTDISGFSPQKEFFVATASYLDRVPVTTLYRNDGSIVAELEVGRSDSLPPDWKWPVPFTATAADGKTQVNGILYYPHDYQEGNKYPLIDNIYGGPQVRNTPIGLFGDATQTHTAVEAAGYARLGAFVIVMDGRGTTERGKAFHDASWRRVQDASSLEDHVAAIHELAARIPDIDLERVGITGFSAGGYASALAAFRHGDLFKVAVAGGGNYDQSLFWHTWGERYHGAFDAEHYRAQAAKTYAKDLRGKILFIHGLRDHGCHPASLFQLLSELVDAHLDYDLVLLPKAAHDITGYGERKRLDYFVTHLFGGTPPKEKVRFARAIDQWAKELQESARSIDMEAADAN